MDGKNLAGRISEQKITLAEAIETYTMGSAYAKFAEAQKKLTHAGPTGGHYRARPRPFRSAGRAASRGSRALDDRKLDIILLRRPADKLANRREPYHAAIRAGVQF